MDFKNISNQDLHLRLEKLTRTERKLTHIILLHINEVESRKLYFEIGFESIYSYLTKGLKYSESAAYRRIQAARLLKTSPTEIATTVAEKLESGALHLSQLTQVQKCLKEEKKKGASVPAQKVSEILQALEHKNTFESEKILATEFNFNIKTYESAKPQRDESVRLEITLSKEQFENLEHAKSLLSHQCNEGNWSEVITALAEKFIRTKHGNHKTLQFGDQTQNTEPHSKMQDSKLQRYRPALPVKVKRQVFAKAKHQCEFMNSTTGHKCNSRYQLEIDHRKPLALGGSDKPENLRILCRAHNQRAWQQSLGAT